jgi:[ribosomal protein S18]-alanine N-acetyltransferase
MHRTDISKIMEIEEFLFPDPWKKEMFYQEIDHEGAFLIEIIDKEICGFICGLQVLDEFLISNIAVKKQYQGCGFGSLLLEYALNLYIRKGCKKCFLEVRRSNAKAIALYQKNGFEVLGVRKAYYAKPPEDAIVMICNLASKEHGHNSSLNDKTISKEHLHNSANRGKDL